MYRLMKTDAEKVISTEKDTILECYQLAETVYFVYLKNKVQFDPENYAIFAEREGEWERVADVRFDSNE